MQAAPSNLWLARIAWHKAHHEARNMKSYILRSVSSQSWIQTAEGDKLCAIVYCNTSGVAQLQLSCTRTCPECLVVLSCSFEGNIGTVQTCISFL